MMFAYRRRFLMFAAVVLGPGAAFAGQPRIDADTCTQLRLEHMKYVASGVVETFNKGPEWGKANLSQDKLRDLELFIQLDEQIKFGCRDAKLTMDAERAGEAAKRLELNPDADPTAPLPVQSGDAANDDGTEAKAVTVAPAKPKKKRKAESKEKAAKTAAGAADQSKDVYVPPAKDASLPPTTAKPQAAPALSP